MNVKWQLAQVVMFVCGVSVAAKGGCSIYSRGKKNTCMSSQGCRDVNTLRLHLWLSNHEINARNFTRFSVFIEPSGSCTKRNRNCVYEF